MACSTTRVIKMGVDYGNVRILSTAETEQPLLAALKDKHVFTDVIPFTATVPLVNNYLINTIHQYAAMHLTAVFTNAEAVKAVANIVNKQAVSWNIACVDKTTYYAVQDIFPDNTIIATAPDEDVLGNKLLDTNTGESKVVYFCGNKYSDSIPVLFRLNNKPLESVMVYQTLIKAAPVSEYYNGILFLSESAVDSFFVFNEMPNNTVGFCLTESVADALTKKLTQATVVVQAKEPTMTALIESVMIYYDRI